MQIGNTEDNTTSRSWTDTIEQRIKLSSIEMALSTKGL